MKRQHQVNNCSLSFFGDPGPSENSLICSFPLVCRSCPARRLVTKQLEEFLQGGDSGVRADGRRCRVGAFVNERTLPAAAGHAAARCHGRHSSGTHDGIVSSECVVQRVHRLVRSIRERLLCKSVSASFEKQSRDNRARAHKPRVRVTIGTLQFQTIEEDA